MKLNVFYEEKKFVIKIDNSNELDIEGLLKFIKESIRLHVFSEFFSTNRDCLILNYLRS